MKHFYKILVGCVTFLSSSLFAQLMIYENAFPNLSFVNPVDIQNAGDGSNRLFVVEQAGRIKVFENNASVPQAGDFLDIRARVLSNDRFGMLGMVFHPDFSNNGYFYVHYTASGPQRSVISRFSISLADSNIADPNSELVLLEIGQPHRFHNGGQLAFGPDGYLYIGMGDGGPGNDPNNQGQNRQTLLGAFLRIDVDNSDGGLNYSIPADNPFVGNTQGFREEIYAWGFRNPWRFAFDPANDWLFAAGNGENLWEEINLVENGKNYGWKIMEGAHCFSPPVGCNTGGLTLPIWEYGGNGTRRSVVGGPFYYGNDHANLFGKYIYGDFLLGDIWSLEYDGVNPPVNTLIAENFPWLSTFGIDEAGEMYMADWINGIIYTFMTPNSIDHPQQALPDKFTLAQNYPNPFNPQTTIRFTLSEAASIDLTVYNAAGKWIKNLVKWQLNAGNYEIQWQGDDNNSQRVASGVYFYKLETTDGFKQIRKMVLLR